MLYCLLGEVFSHLFYSKQPVEVNWWIQPNHIFPQETKRWARKCEGLGKGKTGSYQKIIESLII